MKLSISEYETSTIRLVFINLLFPILTTSYSTSRQTEQPSTNMVSKSSINVAIYDETGIFKHWSLFLDTSIEAEKAEIQVMGSDGRFWFEEKRSNARTADNLLDIFFLCEVDSSKLSSIKEIARKVPIRNEVSGWNCQDFVLDVLEALEGEGIIDGGNEEYVKCKKELRNRQDGLV